MSLDCGRSNGAISGRNRQTFAPSYPFVDSNFAIREKQRYDRVAYPGIGAELSLDADVN